MKWCIFSPKQDNDEVLHDKCVVYGLKKKGNNAWYVYFTPDLTQTISVIESWRNSWQIVKILKQKYPEAGRLSVACAAL